MSSPIKPISIRQRQTIESPPIPLVLAQEFIGLLISTTPDVINQRFFYSHDAATTVTNFLRGQDGQVMKILGNGNTTVSHNAMIKTNTGANKLLAVDIIYTFTYLNGIWYEDE